MSKERREDQHRYPGPSPLTSTLNTLTRVRHRALQTLNNDVAGEELLSRPIYHNSSWFFFVSRRSLI